MSITNFKRPQGGREVTQHVSFTGTGTTLEVSCDGLSKIFSYDFNPTTVVAAADVANYWLAETVNSDGSITVPAAGTVTLTRVAITGGTETTGLGGFIRMIGE